MATLSVPDVPKRRKSLAPEDTIPDIPAVIHERRLCDGRFVSVDHTLPDHGARTIYIWTPLVDSSVLGRKTGFHVLLKMENMQPSGSFKLRGISRLLQKYKSEGVNRIVCPSGGNAGAAAAYAARILNMDTVVVVPKTTPKTACDLIRSEGARLEVHGSTFDDACKVAQEMAKSDNRGFVPPFDHPVLWDGISIMVDEIFVDLDGVKPDVFLISVGGGSMLCGLVEGCRRHGWGDVPIVAVETEGTRSFNASVEAGHLVTLPSIDGLAKTLGVKRVCQQAWSYYGKHPIISVVCTDKEAVDACVDFVDDHRCLVEVSCGATLSLLYTGILKKLVHDGKLKRSTRNVVAIVCGGNAVSMKLINHWKADFDLTRTHHCL